MKASRFTDAQKAFIIKQGEDGTPVDEMQAIWKVSQRRACGVIGLDPKTYRYRSCRPIRPRSNSA